MAAEEANPKGGSKPGVRGAARRDRPPVTIDLEANAAPTAEASSEAHAASTAATPEAAAEGERPMAPPSSAGDTSGAVPAAGESRPGLLMLGLAGAAGGLVVLILGFGLQAAGVLPAPGRSAAAEALAETSGLKSTVTGFDQRVTAIEAASAQTIADRALLDDLARQVGVVDAFGTSLSDRLLNVEAKIAALNESLGSTGDAATRQSLDALAERVGRLESAPPAAGGEAMSAPAMAELGSRVETDRAALETLRGRVDTLASEVAALEAKLDGMAKTPAAVNDGERGARAIAIGALRQASARGGPFAADLAVIGALGIGAADLAALAPLAEKGAPSRAELLAGFPAVADAILAARRPAGEGAGIFDRVLSYGRGLVKIRPTGPISGSDPVAVVSRMQAAVEDGDLAKALSEREGLPEAGKAASEAWATGVSDRLAIDRLVDDIAGALGAGEGSG
jgi:hypothetical protein